MMITKSVIHKMIAKYPETKYRNNVAGYGNNIMSDCFYALFDCCIDPISKVYLSEDYLFCKRWIDMGGELWLDLNTNLNHTGIIDYKGCLAMTIGEVDVLNKDAQILRAQEEQPSINSGANGDNQQKKKKNKKNKKKKNQSGDKNIVQPAEDNESSSNDDEEINETKNNETVSKKDIVNLDSNLDNELIKKMTENSHC